MDFKQKRCCRCYARISTDLQSEISIEAQTYRMKKWAKSKDFDDENIICYEDKGFSGKTLKRDGLKKLLDEVQDYDTIVCYSLSRFSRNTKSFLDMIELFKQRNITFASTTENLCFEKNNPFSLMFSQILAVMAETESNITSSRVSSSMSFLSRQNRLKKKPQYGMKFVAKGLDYVKDEGEHKIIEYIIKLWKEDLTLSQICQRLKFEGIHARPKKDGQKVEFYPELVKKILKRNNLYTE